MANDKRVFNRLIPTASCQRNCKDGWIVDKKENIVEIDGKPQHCECYYENKFLDANIGRAYWNLTVDNFDGHRDDIERMKDYISKIKEMYESGFGLYIHGGNGAGKTSLAMLLLMTVLRHSKASAMFVPFADLVILNSRVISGYHDKEAERDVNIIKNVDFLVLDDIGKEFDDGKDKTRATLNSILRYRDMWNKPTIYTANSPIEDLRTHYGDSNYSIMEGRSRILTMVYDRDYRKEKKMEEGS